MKNIFKTITFEIKYWIMKLLIWDTNRKDTIGKQGLIKAKNIKIYDYFPGNTALRTKNFFVKENNKCSQ